MSVSMKPVGYISQRSIDFLADNTLGRATPENIHASISKAPSYDTTIPLYAIPEGYVIVPKEPTDFMIVRGTEEWLCVRDQLERAEIIYAAMLAAAPGNEGEASDG